MKLVIVESPTKCETISHYLGSDYKVIASKGHIRDLSTRGVGGLGIDVDGDFSPTYVVSKGKQPVVNEIVAEAKKAKEVIIATDPDREGEAIGWHLAQMLNLNLETTKRLEFHEITEESIKYAIENPRIIDLDLVASQETRRILDRIIGFKLSALVTKKINSPSAGRVQSATLKLICDHDQEIKAFVPEEYWTLGVELSDKNNLHFSVNIDKINGEKARISSLEENESVLSKLNDKTVKVIDISKKKRTTESKPPFTTSTLQQEAYNIYKFSTKKTSVIAQKLYEGVKVNDKQIGLISYIRTDSTLLSNTFVNKATSYITDKFGSDYVGKIKKGKTVLAQNAHEAIRPTDCNRTPESIETYLSPDEFKLYKLIYERALSSLMSAHVDEVKTAQFECNGVTFKCDLVTQVYDGFEKVYSYSRTKNDPDLKFATGDVLDILSIKNEQKFTEPPAQYSEAKIVKMMEELGIGRPSTYASTIATILKRGYVTSKSGVLTPTDQGVKTSHVLDKYFPEFVDAKFTSEMETNLDSVADGKFTRTEFISRFYKDFMDQLKVMSEKMYKDPDVETGEICPKCGSPLVIKKGKHGEFVACSNYPKCSYIKKEEKTLKYTGETCPECGAPLVERKKGKSTFVACSAFPKCKYIKPTENKKENEVVIISRKCPKCGGDLIEKRGKYSTFVGCSNYPKCKYQEKINKKSD